MTEGGHYCHHVVGRPRQDEDQEDGEDGPSDATLAGHYPLLTPLLGPEAGAGRSEHDRGLSVEVRSRGGLGLNFVVVFDSL